MPTETLVRFRGSQRHMMFLLPLVVVCISFTGYWTAPLTVMGTGDHWSSAYKLHKDGDGVCLG